MVHLNSMFSCLRHRTFIAAIVATALLLQMSVGTARADQIDLGFMLDRSGSVGGTNYNVAKQALANALALIPTAGPNTYRIGVVSFGSDVRTVIPPTVLTAANLAGIQAAINSDAFTGGFTHMWDAINQSVTNFGALGDVSLLNMTTDGNPLCRSGYCDNNTSAPFDLTTAAASNAAAQGWDGLSFESIGNSVDTAFLQSIAFPGPAPLIGPGDPIPDPTLLGFVLALNNFGEYDAAIASKVQQIVNPNPVPVPAAIWLFGTALLGFVGVSRRRTPA